MTVILTPTATCTWRDSWHFRWLFRERTAGCPSSHTGTPSREEGTMTQCRSSVGSVVEGPLRGVRNPSQPLLAKEDCLRVSVSSYPPDHVWLGEDYQKPEKFSDSWNWFRPHGCWDLFELWNCCLGELCLRSKWKQCFTGKFNQNELWENQVWRHFN